MTSFLPGRPPKGNYKVIIEVARAIVVVLGLSVIFAFVHLVLGFTEELSSAEREEISQDNNTGIEQTSSEHERYQTLHAKPKLCEE